MVSSCIAILLRQRRFDLPADKRARPPFPFEQPQQIPQPDDFAFFPGVHDPPPCGARLEQTTNKNQAATDSGALDGTHKAIPAAIVLLADRVIE
jgi:hypothetical protein